jgi:hypothetical protein
VNNVPETVLQEGKAEEKIGKFNAALERFLRI